MGFSGDGVFHVTEGFEINQFGDLVVGGEAGMAFGFVFGDSAFEIVGDSDVEDSGGAGHYVDVVDHREMFAWVGVEGRGDDWRDGRIGDGKKGEVECAGDSWCVACARDRREIPRHGRASSTTQTDNFAPYGGKQERSREKSVGSLRSE